MNAPRWWWHGREVVIDSPDGEARVLENLRRALRPEPGRATRSYGDYRLFGEADRYRVLIRAAPGRRRGGATFVGHVTATPTGSRLAGSPRLPLVGIPVLVLVSVTLMTSVAVSGGHRPGVGGIAVVAVTAAAVWAALSAGLLLLLTAVLADDVAFVELWLRNAVAGR